ncbi:cystathionine beta-lyase/cystathionine gamma-synthase [Peribacillus deserti]|uniref:Cystathionine beta-lyase/cystathionine gamma-synthase n=1 Tax=Peribacillus deserti TaxID=673318 RepID=A0ABS2QF59_9BACI|nr:aminotransferase class I/II-fold pyridoxal phosphate-dependent enzyme [Peribacillus deserti]MBM7690941.1 cystathionine beta-lyase/cystathionine gamma-synthase [Peribacillus deserti]
MNKQEEFYRDQRICMNYSEESERFEGAVIPPTYGNTLFTYTNFEAFIEAEKNQQTNYVYRRGTNPTVEAAERKLAALERGETCKCFSSGMAAISASLMASVKSGDHILCISHLYACTLDLLKYLSKFGVKHTIIDSTEIEDIKAAITDQTKVIYMENPTNTYVRIIDLKAVAALAKSKGIRTILDNSWATPLFQKPLTYGIDIVVHSLSKYLGGHSDLMGGALITSKEIMESIFNKEYLLMGGVMGPYEASLLLKGLRSLPLRMLAHQDNAKQIAEFLSSHPKISAVHHPGLPSHPDYEKARDFLTGFSGLISFELKEESFEQVKMVINNMRVFQIGVSWGSYESLVLSPNYGYNVEKIKEEGISSGIIRLSVGLEHADLLIDDLNKALMAR